MSASGGGQDARTDERAGEPVSLTREDGLAIVTFDAPPLNLFNAALSEGLDAVVVNDISREDIGFDVEVNEVAILAVDGERQETVQYVPRASKTEVAEAILDAVERLRGGA